MQGPFPPWCVGSVLSAPQLVTSDLGPLFFHQEETPKCILYPGRQEKQIEVPVSVRTQINAFMLSSSEPFVPSDLLQEYLVEDGNLDETKLVCDHPSLGNRLQSVKCSDGKHILFFPIGENQNKIGSVLCYPGADGTWFPAVNCSNSAECSDEEDTKWSMSPAFQFPIHQLSAVRLQSSSSGRDDANVAARTAYQVYFCTTSRKKECIQFVSTAVATFQVQVLHVTWNPHLDGEAAVIVANGEIYLFDPKTPKADQSNTVVDLKAKLILERPVGSKLSGPELVSKQKLDLEPGDIAKKSHREEEDKEKKWWCCEFGWHPQLLLVCGYEEVYQLDFREEQSREDSERREIEEHRIFGDIDILARAASSHKFVGYCPLNPGEQRFLAFARAEYDGMWVFSVATEKYVILFDVRRTQTPILQWEHDMREGPPELLIMCRLSTLKPFDDAENETEYQNGRVIVAVNFLSGDMRVFCYGSKVTQDIALTEKRLQSEGCGVSDWHEVTYAWEVPAKLYAPRAVHNGLREVLSSSQGLFSAKSYGLFMPRINEGPECTSGVVFLCNPLLDQVKCKLKKGFTLLQLTGLGEILAQQYKVSDQAQSSPKAYPDPMLDLTDVRMGSTLAASFSNKLDNPPVRSTEVDTANTADCAQDRTSAHTASFDGKRRRPEADDFPTLPGSRLEKNGDQHYLKKLLNGFLQNLSAPLSIYELSQAVLSKGLPERLSPFAAGMPSTLHLSCYVSHKFPTVLPLLHHGAPTQSSNTLSNRGSSEVGTMLSRESIGSKAIPLPVVLEIQDLMKFKTSSRNVRQKKDLGIEICVEGENGGDQANTAVENPVADIVADGHKLLVESCNFLEDAINQLVAKTNSNTAVVSLSDPTEAWLANAEELNCPIFVHDVSIDYPGQPESTRVASCAAETGPPLTPSSYPQNVGMGEQKTQPARKNWVYKYFAGKSRKSHQIGEGSRLLQMDAELCPVKLYNTHSEDPLEEELEDEEWAALENMKAELLKWQQGFAPYDDSYG